MKKAILFTSLGILIGLLIGGLYWYGQYNQLYEDYLQAVKLVKYASNH